MTKWTENVTLYQAIPQTAGVLLPQQGKHTKDATQY
jgi:hypothetical protein